ncbi:MAG: hypothetical protein WDO71_03520 [Bacteroidota bacterium]
MEYPMITLITSPDANEEHLDGVIAMKWGTTGFTVLLPAMKGIMPGWMKG